MCLIIQLFNMKNISIEKYNSVLNRAENLAVSHCRKELENKEELKGFFSAKAFPLEENQKNGRRRFGILFQHKENGTFYLAEIGKRGFKKLHTSAVNHRGELVPEGRVLFPYEMNRDKSLTALLEIANQKSERFLNIVQNYSHKVNGRKEIPRVGSFKIEKNLISSFCGA